MAQQAAAARATVSRSALFRPGRQPLQSRADLQLRKAKGPVGFLNPTSAEYRAVAPKVPPPKGQDEPAPPYSLTDDQNASSVGYRWTSRNNRKGRHQLVVDAKNTATTLARVPTATTNVRHVLRIVLHMFTRYPVWDVSWLVAYLFVWGSIVWIVNGFFAFLPQLDYSDFTERSILYGGGITAFIGATIFEIGSILLMLEAVNENRGGCFGWAVKQAFVSRRDGRSGPGSSDDDVDAPKTAVWQIVPDLDGSCCHHHRNRKNLVGKPSTKRTDVESQDADTAVDDSDAKTWTWFPTWQDLRTHYIRELGFLACFAQLIGATVFWIAGFTALPGIYNHMSQGLTDGIYWTPQVIGATGFVISGVLFMVETQSKWYIPNLKVLGWHIGLWNLVGGLGFLLSPAFGYSPASWAQYEAACSTFWGSWAFMIGSTIQLYESLEKNPLELKK